MLEIASVVVLHYPNMEELNRHLAVLYRQVGKIIIVDNSSRVTDFSLYDVISLYSICYLKNQTNLGIAAAQNIGIKWALNNGYSHVLLLDQDSVPDDNMVTEMLAGESYLLSKGVKVGAVAPCCYDEVFGEKICMPRSAGDNSDYYIKDISLISSGMLIRSEVLQDVGGMNEWLFIDGVDDDWCCRAMAKGYELFHVLGSKMAHSLGQAKKILGGVTSFRYHQPFRYYFMFRNYIFLTKQSYVCWTMKFRYIRTMIKLLVKTLFLTNKAEYLRQAIRGTKDGVLNGK